jgi:Ulp1 family protease
MKINQAENKPPGSMQHFPSAQPTPAEKRTRLIDKLDAPSPASRQHTIISGADRKAVSEDTGPAQKHARQHAAHESASPETSHATISTRRVTRSQVELERSQGRSQSETPSRALGPQWSRDLVYPHAGRRAAIVHFDDLARLDHDGFLNDNLILFFMRYLETHMEKNNPEVYKRMHFFNSYFYEALTKAPKAKKSLNYEAVSRWTKNINLFSRDFVVVPVNENLHWYVAIICNLPYFLGDKGDSGWPERTLGVDHADERDEDEGEEEADAQTALTQNSLAELSISDGEKDGRNAAKKKGPGRRRTARRSLPKYPVNKPVIITLDSLGHSRSATCSHLRNYVALEAKDKRNLDINPAELRGMTAKEIPTQSNFSDCGLFVCVYLEQFVADPYNFVRRILQRDGSEQQWPRRIHSEDLRSRLRELILEMHRRQEKESTKQDEPIIGNILIDKRTPSPTPPPVHEKQPTKQDIKEAQEKFEELMGARGERYDSHEDPTVEQNPPAAANETTDVIHTVPDSQEYYDDDDGRDIIINDEVSKVRTERPPKSRLGCEPQLKQTLPSASTARARASPLLTHTRPSPKDRTHSNPVELAERLREGRTEQPLRKRRRVTQLEKSPEKMRASRSPSRLTDELLSGEKAWLPGIESFAAHVSAGPVPATTGHENARRTMRENMSPSPSPSSEPEIVGERKVLSGKQISGLRKRKRPAGKLQAPETAEDLARGELNGFYDNADAGVPESLEARLKHRSSS